MKRVKVALVGNPNVGKTAIMNALAGTSEKVGNWPGVTVQKKVGKYHFKGFEIELIDLPGIYSLTSFTLEERVTRNFLLSGDYNVVANVIDATLLGRNLYLTLELLEMGIRPVVALNKVDELKEFGFSVNSKELAKLLRLPVVEVSALKRKGLEELSETFLMVATGDLKPEGFTPTYSEKVENAIELLKLKLKGELPPNFPFNLRWFAVKLLEKDEEVTQYLKNHFKNSDEILKEIERIEKELHPLYNCDLPSLIARERFLLASKIARKVVKSGEKEPEVERLSDKVDKIVTNPLTGIPIFFAVMWAVFKLTFTLSQPLSEAIDWLFSGLLPEVVGKVIQNPTLLSLVNDGILAGIGAVMVFLPVLAILYLLMAVLEDTGYMARAAALWDNFMRKFGLSGASVIPMILGFGCNVPAVYATRAMRSHYQKLITMAIIPWMSCSARLTVYTVFVAAFFREHQASVMLGLYGFGVLLALGLATVMSKFLKSEEDDFFIELPPYKLPAWSVVVNQTLIEVREFITKAGTVIFAASLVIWALASLPPGSGYAGENSLVGRVGKALLPVFEPIGIQDWKPIVALIFGALAKEVVVGTMGTLYGTGESGLIKVIQSTFTPESAFAFLVFTLLYIPCVATIAAIKQESGSWKFPAGVVAVELAVAWSAAFLTYNAARAIF
ncbi:ferrous iron transport protein B [Thermovibrio ammonificans HB-1]|uniref:Ferrous iron transport protein B n=1 Tax=Thermovibrio ammonificans (strain DSM 15698 / JCM 12110 / HB-1) TaxID=648996 RepID=E8T465_THEA1|nr:ferrous iron transport protein B [Thermovibrio ammonificans]ADU97394.1 ferrous iron transport protein B [Thermovibrio ammonificans HB-1]